MLGIVGQKGGNASSKVRNGEKGVESALEI